MHITFPRTARRRDRTLNTSADSNRAWPWCVEGDATQSVWAGSRWLWRIRR